MFGQNKRVTVYGLPTLIVYVNSEVDVSKLKEKLEAIYVFLKFTHEIECNKFQFLDVDMKIKDTNIQTEVFAVSTN